MNIKGAIFDMDGTLVDSLMVWNVLWKRIGEKYKNDASFVPSDEDNKAVRTMTLRQAMCLLHSRYALADSAEELLDYTNNMLIGFYKNDVELKIGAREFLEYCYENSVKMCIASATAPDLIRIALKSCDIEKYFSEIFSCSTIGIGKEEPDIFIIARDYLGTPHDETWVFEDSAMALKTAFNAGFRTVGIYDEHNPWQDKVKEYATVYISKDKDLSYLI